VTIAGRRLPTGEVVEEDVIKLADYSAPGGSSSSSVQQEGQAGVGGGRGGRGAAAGGLGVSSPRHAGAAHRLQPLFVVAGMVAECPRAAAAAAVLQSLQCMCPKVCRSHRGRGHCKRSTMQGPACHTLYTFATIVLLHCPLFFRWACNTHQHLFQSIQCSSQM
jgi:hypothetical protein